jgi:hypothetical protein
VATGSGRPIPGPVSDRSRPPVPELQGLRRLLLAEPVGGGVTPCREVVTGQEIGYRLVVEVGMTATNRPGHGQVGDQSVAVGSPGVRVIVGDESVSGHEHPFPER